MPVGYLVVRADCKFFHIDTNEKNTIVKKRSNLIAPKAKTTAIDIDIEMTIATTANLVAEVAAVVAKLKVWVLLSMTAKATAEVCKAQGAAGAEGNRSICGGGGGVEEG